MQNCKECKTSLIERSTFLLKRRSAARRTAPPRSSGSMAASLAHHHSKGGRGPIHSWSVHFLPLEFTRMVQLYWKILLVSASKLHLSFPSSTSNGGGFLHRRRFERRRERFGIGENILCTASMLFIPLRVAFWREIRLFCLKRNKISTLRALRKDIIRHDLFSKFSKERLNNHWKIVGGL